MSSTINFGIDLGTTNSAIAKYSGGQVEIFRNPINLKQTLPSVIAFRKQRIVVGDKARELLQKDARNVIGTFKRKMGTSDKYFVEATDAFISPEELSAIILKELKNFIHTGETVEAAVITIPASFDTMQSNATKKAGYRAGFQQVVLLQEPIAASLAFGNKQDQDLSDRKWLVYDLGGGTFDVALVAVQDGEMRVLDHEGDNYLGGTDFDKAIVEQILIPHLEQHGTFANLDKEMKSASGRYNRLYNLLLYKAEEVKIMLSNVAETEIEFETEDDTGDELDIFLTITRAQLEEIVHPFLDRTRQMIGQVLSRNELAMEELEFVLLIGGSTYMPVVREYLAEQLQIPVNCDMDPTTAVAAGAAYFAGTKLKQLSKPAPEDQPARSQPTSVADLSMQVAFEKVSQDTHTPFIARSSGNLKHKFYRITRKDGGFDSGLKPLSDEIMEYLPLVPGAYNLFDCKIYDQLNNPIEVELPEIGITQGKFSIDGQPLPLDICLEVDETEDETTFLEPIFRKNDILPLKKTIVKEISRNIRKDTADELIINIVEGPVDSIASANKTIGFIKITGAMLEKDLIRGADVELTFEMSESRDLTVEVYLSIGDQEFVNVFSPSESFVDLDLIQKELETFQHNLRSKLSQAERSEDYDRAGRIQKLQQRIENLQGRIGELAIDDVTDEKYQIDEAKRQIARDIHGLFNVSLLRTALETYFNAKKAAQQAVQSELAQPQDAQKLENILNSEKEVINKDDLGLIKMKTNQLDSLRSAIYNRRETTKEDIIFAYLHYRSLSYEKREKASDLIKKGNLAMDKENMSVLTGVVNELYLLKKQEDKGDIDTFKNSGTGLR